MYLFDIEYFFDDSIKDQLINVNLYATIYNRERETEGIHNNKFKIALLNLFFFRLF